MSPKYLTIRADLFLRVFNKATFKSKTGLNINFVQDNQSVSDKGVLRGLHYQKGKYAQAKLVRVIKGQVLDVIVDIRPNSKTYGEYVSVKLSGKNNKQLYIARGFAHGFLTLENNTIFSYKCDNFYNKDSESGIYFNDPKLNINWGYSLNKIILSEKDKALPLFENTSK